MKLYESIKTSKRNFLNYTFFTIHFLIVIALINAGKIDYVRDIVFIVIVVALYIFIESKYNIYVSNYIRGCVMLLIYVHNFGGKYLDFYLTSTIFDKVLHVFGTYSAVLFFFSIMNQLMQISFKAEINKFVFLVLLGVSLGAIFEILEFAVDVILNPRIHNQPDLTDTDLDMISDLIGALAAAFHVGLKDVQLQLPKLK